MKDIVVATAFERKAELGGKFRGTVLDKRTGVRYESSIVETVAEARNWAKRKVQSLMVGQPYRPGYCYKPYWRMYCWVRD